MFLCKPFNILRLQIFQHKGSRFLRKRLSILACCVVVKERRAFLQQEFSQKILARAQAKSVPFFILAFSPRYPQVLLVTFILFLSLLWHCGHSHSRFLLIIISPSYPVCALWHTCREPVLPFCGNRPQEIWGCQGCDR